jgi:hypothetical protein
MFVVTPRASRLRSAAESTIQNVYWKRYGAILPDFADTIVAEIEGCGRLICAAGLRFGDETFLSESYLDQPVEGALQDLTSAPLHRGDLAEVCHLASAGPNRSIPFVRSVIRFLAEHSIEWAVFTATEPLRELLQRSGIAMLELGRASRGRLAHPGVWGTYFEHDPRVMAVSRHDVISREMRPQFVRSARQSIDAQVL